MPNNSHSFVSYIRNTRVFSLILIGISVSLSWIISFIQKMPITIDMTKVLFALKLVVTMRVKKVALTISTTLLKLTNRPTVTLLVKKISFVNVMHQIIIFVITLRATKVLLIPIMHMITKMGTWLLAIPKIAIAASILVAQFNILSTFDPQLLSDLDAETLADMDYTISP